MLTLEKIFATLSRTAFGNWEADPDTTDKLYVKPTEVSYSINMHLVILLTY